VTLSGHTTFVSGVAFSSDHSYLASCAFENNLNIWSATTSWPLKNHLLNGPCDALIQLPNGQLAASSSTSIKIWSPLNNSPNPLRTLTGHTNLVLSLSLSPDGTMLASGSYDNTVRLWGYATQSTALKTFSGHTSVVRAVRFVSNQILASGSDDKTIKIWDVSSGKSKYISLLRLLYNFC
jgi:WD40 repeat protein